MRGARAPGGPFKLLSDESLRDFNELMASLQLEYKPTTELETRLVEAVAQHFWLMQRAIKLQNDLLTSPQLDHRAFGLYLREQASHERAYYRAMHQLRAIKKEKLKGQIAPEPQDEMKPKPAPSTKGLFLVPRTSRLKQ